MKWVIAGGSGFIGRYILRYFSEKQEEITVLSRNPHRAEKKVPIPGIRWVAWDGRTTGEWMKILEGADVVVNLAGHPIAGVWTVPRKQKIYHSRINSTRALVKALREVKNPPHTFIQISATGFYGDRGDEILTEESEQGSGFLAAVVDQWEAVSRDVEAIGIRRIVLRAGVVLGRDGGFLPVLLPSFNWFLGGMPGDGMNWFSWIHVKEIPPILEFVLHHATLTGVLNGVAPEPVRFEEFCQTLGKVIGRPCWVKIPEFLIRLLPGHQGEEMVLVSQRVVPARLVQAGYQFQFPTLYVALSEIFNKQDVPVISD